MKTLRTSKLIKPVLSILLIGLMTAPTNIINVQAKTLSSSQVNYTKTDNIAKMKTEFSKTHTGTVVSNVEKYTEFTEYKDSNGDEKMQPKEYTKDGYLNQIEAETISDNARSLFPVSAVAGTIVTPGPQRSWLRTSLQITSYGTGTGYVDVTGFFEWLSQPLIKMSDAVALAHDSNTYFPVENISCQVGFPLETLNGEYMGEKYITQTSKSSGYQTDSTTGFGFTFSMADSQSAMDYYPFGYINARAMKANVQTLGSTMCFAYGHSQVGVNIVPSIRFPGGASISLTPSISIDPVSVSAPATGF